MASESTMPAPAHTDTADRPIIDNQVPAYHAVSVAAITSLVFGIGSILSYVSTYFTILGALAIAFGLIAQKNIRRMPDALTGVKMANAGTALGLLFSLSSLTIIGVQSWMIDREAARFARVYVESLNTGSIDEALYWENDAEARKGKSVADMKKTFGEGSKEGGMYEMQTATLREIFDRLKSTPGQTVELGKQIGHGSQGMEVYAEFLLVLKGPKSQKYPEETQYASVSLMGTPQGRGYGWKVIHLKYPAKAPGSR